VTEGSEGSNVRAQARSDYFDIRSRYGNADSTRTIQRTSGQLFWEPDALPRLAILGQRNATHDEAAGS
jgi:hypothetical protein